MFWQGDTKELVLPFPEEEIVTKQGTAIPEGDAASVEKDPLG
jgi:hypothetical protein